MLICRRVILRSISNLVITIELSSRTWINSAVRRSCKDQKFSGEILLLTESMLLINPLLKVLSKNQTVHPIQQGKSRQNIFWSPRIVFSIYHEEWSCLAVDKPYVRDRPLNLFRKYYSCPGWMISVAGP
jgi:hypothetical protein